MTKFHQKTGLIGQYKMRPKTHRMIAGEKTCRFKVKPGTGKNAKAYLNFC